MWRSGLLGLGCSLVNLPCLQSPLVAMAEWLLVVLRSGLFVGSWGHLLIVEMRLVARSGRSIVLSPVASSFLTSVAVSLFAEVLVAESLEEVFLSRLEEVRDHCVLCANKQTNKLRARSAE